MSDNMAKEASAQKIISKSISELADNIAKSGYKVKGGVNSVIKNEVKSDFGVVGLAGGALKSGAKAVKNGVNKVAPNTAGKALNNAIDKTKPIQENLSKARKGMENTVANMDMKGGAVGHKVAPGKSKDLFVKTKKVELDQTDKLGNKMYSEHKTTSLSEPLRKARNVAVPMAGGMYLADKMEKLKYNPAEEKSDLKKSAETRDNVIDKVANIMQNDIVYDNDIYTTDSVTERAYSKSDVYDCLEKMTKLASDASEMLKLASAERESFMDKIACLIEDNEKLQLEIKARDKTEKCIKLADEMLHKGLIKQASYDDKVEELEGLEDNSLYLMEDMIGSMPIYKTAYEVAEGVSSLEFVTGSTEQTIEKPRFIDTFL